MYSIGLDVSKSTINVYVPINDLDMQISNDVKAIKSLYSKLKKLYKKDIDKLIFVFEPTGHYSNGLNKFCAEHEIKCFIINPKKSHNFAKAIGNRNKTDVIDAKMLSNSIVVAKQKEIKVPIVNPCVEEIKELITFYKLLIKQKVQCKNHLEAITVKDGSKYVSKTLTSKIKMLVKQEKETLTAIRKIIMKDKKLYNAFINIQTIKGVGEISSIILLHHFIRYPDSNQRQIVSLAGLDPTSKFSGTSVHGKSRISKSGSKLCRGILFMGCLVAIKHNEELKVFYNRLKENGKHSTVAQVAVMRKIIILAYAIYKNNEVYEPEKYLQYS